MVSEPLRKKFKWTVDVVSLDGSQQAQQTVLAYWSPDHELTNGSVSDAACARAWVKAGMPKGVKFIPASEPELLS